MREEVVCEGGFSLSINCFFIWKYIPWEMAGLYEGHGGGSIWSEIDVFLVHSFKRNRIEKTREF